MVFQGSFLVGIADLLLTCFRVDVEGRVVVYWWGCEDCQRFFFLQGCVWLLPYLTWWADCAWEQRGGSFDPDRSSVKQRLRVGADLVVLVSMRFLRKVGEGVVCVCVPNATWSAAPSHTVVP